MRTSVRILTILGAYFAASLAAGCVYWVILVLLDPADLLNPSLFTTFVAVIVFFGGFAAIFALLSALPGIIYAERTGVRSFWFYGYGGALTGILAYGLYVGVFGGWWSVLEEVSTVDRAGAWIISAAAGFTAGLVYWLIAGRRAGLWRLS